MKMQWLFAGLCAGLLLAGCAGEVGIPVAGPALSVLANTPPVPPAAGDTAVYRVTNAYRREVIGEVHYRVESTSGGQILVAVTPGTPLLGPPRTEVYTPEGNWLRHPVTNHDQLVEYEFAPLYPAYPLPLDFEKSWSLRVAATNPASGRRVSVRVDGRVLGGERIVTPAGAFDTIKIGRTVYAGDRDGPILETTITETDWYAPALGRAVRAESRSQWLDLRQGAPSGFLSGDARLMRGDWHIYELVGRTSK